MFITDGSMQNLRRSIDTINRALDGKKKVDLFECARVDPNTPVEQVMRSLKELSAEGKFDYIGVSETSAATLQKAAAVADIAAVEIEVSPWSYEDETRKVIAIAAERRIPIIAYSPLGRGLLTGKITLETLDQDDPRRRFSRFKEDAMGHNQQIIDALARIAEAKGITMAQFSLAWVCSLGPHMVPIPGSTKVHRIEENFAAAQIKLTEEEVTTIRDIVADIGVKGGRFADLKHLENLWG
ncbi:hypothetical protein FRB90_010242 [Tulasnella sp. 427]|nr:hypothetical protein FRB90_010242 [Tulasnella sp. 427]